MEDKFNYDDFEEFLQDQVRNHRMYPADAVWREIDKKLHGEKRWPALTIAATMLVSATVLICIYFTPKPNIFAIPTANVKNSTQLSSQKNNLLNTITSPAPFEKEKQAMAASIQNGLPVLVATSPNPSPKNLIEPFSTISANDTKLISSTSTTGTQIKTELTTKLSTPVSVNNKPVKQIAETRNTFSTESDEQVRITEDATLAINKKDVAPKKVKASDGTSVKEYNDKNMVDDFLNDHKGDINLHTVGKKINLKKKFSYVIYVAPSVSYRKLLEDNSIKENNGGPVGLNYVTDVNKVVRHKPGTGIEAGVSIMYNLSDKVRVKSGFQFNMRQYSIEAYRTSGELATIALMGTNRIDTINTVAIYRNNNGYYSTQLVNRYYQLSVPVGVEWEIIGNKRIQLNVAGTIQPTYLLNRNAYLLSTNFKNYTESPGMVRQWNINSNIEAFISFKAGDFKWQVGPQLRYQPYSTFIPEYTIKEHLMDYGIKLGVSKTIN